MENINNTQNYTGKKTFLNNSPNSAEYRYQQNYFQNQNFIANNQNPYTNQLLIFKTPIKNNSIFCPEIILSPNTTDSKVLIYNEQQKQTNSSFKKIFNNQNLNFQKFEKANFIGYKDNQPKIKGINLINAFNNEITNRTNKTIYPYTKNNVIVYMEKDDNAPQEIINKNVSNNNPDNEESKTVDIVSNCPDDKIIYEQNNLISDILNIYSKANKYKYNFDTLNIDFQDFISNISLTNDENDNNDNIPIIKKELNNSNDKMKKCNCKNSSCLKFYCECFSRGKYCDNCFCCECKNIEKYEKERQESYKNIFERNPKASNKMKSNKKSWTCRCKNSNCIKSYCDCYHNNKTCTTKCKCQNCMNKKSGIRSIKPLKRRRIRGAKRLIINNNIYLTPIKTKNDSYYNQSTTDITNNTINILYNKDINSI